MKKILIAILLVGAFSTGASAQKRVAFTNIELIMSVMPAMKEIQKKVEEYEVQLNSQLSVTQKYYEQKAQEYYSLKQANAMTPDKEKKLVNDIAALEEELMSKQEVNEQKVLAMQVKMLQPIQDQLQKAINEVAKEKGYAFVLNQVMGEGVPTILYGKPEHDITEAILTKLGIKMPEEEAEPKTGN